MQQQTGGGVAPSSPHTGLSRTRPLPLPLPRPCPLNHTLAGGLQAGQTNGAFTENRQSRPSSAGNEPSPNNKVSELDILLDLEIQRLQTLNVAHECQPSQLDSCSAANNDQQPPPGLSSAANKDQQLPPGLPSTANEGSRPPAASPSLANEHKQQPPVLRSASLEMQGRRRSRRRSSGAAADSPPSKCRKIDHQVDSLGLSRWRSNWDRHPTMKAAEER